MPIVKHGTNLQFGTSMQSGNIDVTRGGGEFGRGFYTQYSGANALAWAIGRFPPSQRPCLLEVEIDDNDYNALDIKTLKMKTALRLTRKLRKQKTTGSYLENRDVVTGPLNGHRKKEQQKFESSGSQTLLNGQKAKRTVI